MIYCAFILLDFVPLTLFCAQRNLLGLKGAVVLQQKAAPLVSLK